MEHSLLNLLQRGFRWIIHKNFDGYCFKVRVICYANDVHILLNNTIPYNNIGTIKGKYNKREQARTAVQRKKGAMRQPQFCRFACPRQRQ